MNVRVVYLLERQDNEFSAERRHREVQSLYFFTFLEVFQQRIHWTKANPNYIRLEERCNGGTTKKCGSCKKVSQLLQSSR